MNDFDTKIIGQRLKDARKAIGLTQKEIARRCDFQTSFISEMEGGVKKIHPKYLFYLASDWNIDINWILTGKGSMYSPGIDIKWDFGKDNDYIMEMIYLLNEAPGIRYEILRDYSKIRNNNAEQIKKYLEPKK